MMQFFSSICLKSRKIIVSVHILKRMVITAVLADKMSAQHNNNDKKKITEHSTTPPLNPRHIEMMSEKNV